MTSPTPGGGPESGQAAPGRPPRRGRGTGGLVIARPFGIPVLVSPYWFVVAALLTVVYANSLESGITSATERYLVAGVFVVLLYLSVLVHELSHCVVALAFKLKVNRVLLYPLGGFSEIAEEPATPGPEFAVAAAGPAISLALAAIGYALAHVAGTGLLYLIIRQLYLANLLVGLFNLLPGLPLDGGRILRAGVWKLTRKPATATLAAAWAGRVLAAALAVFAAVAPGPGQQGAFSYNRLWLLMIAAFIWIQSGQSIRAAKIRAKLPALTARTLARRAIAVPADLPVSEAIRRADDTSARAMVIVDHQNTPTALVSETAVAATPAERRPWVQVGAMARAIDPGLVLSADLSGMDLLAAVREHPASEYLLIEPSGAVFGVLATADLDLAFAGR